MENAKVKDWVLDIGADLIGGILIAVGIYNFALHANFPVAGFSGIAIILYHIFGSANWYRNNSAECSGIHILL